MVVPDPPLLKKQDKDDLVLIASTHSPTPSQRFSQFKGSSSSLTSQSDSAIPDDDFVSNTETSHLSNLALFARNKTPSESVWTNIYSRYSKVRTGSQRCSNSCLRKYVRNKNLNFDVKHGIACAIPELYGEDAYSYQDSEYSYSDTPVSYSNPNISVGVNGFLSSSRYKTSNFASVSVGKGLQHEVGEGQGTLFYQSAYNTQDLPESSSVASGSSKRSSKNKNSKLKKEAFSASRTESVKPFFCLYGKIVHTDDCKCFKINLWKRCLLPGCHSDKVSNTDTFGNIYQNNLDEDVYDVDKHVSSLSEEITADTGIAVSQPKSVTESIHSGQSCTQKLEPVCESAKETDNQSIQHGLETDWGIGEEITQKYNSAIADLRVFSPETALPLIPQTPNYSSREESDLESCLALFDNLLIDIDDQLEREVPHTSKNSIAEQRGLYPWAALNSQSTTAMASQGKKNKNQFVRKAAPASPVNNTDEGGSSRFSVTNVTSKGMRLAEVSVDCSSHGTSQKDVNVTNKIELTRGFRHEFGLEQHGIPPDACVGDAHNILGQSSSLGRISTPSVNIQYSEQLSFVPRIHSHPYSILSTGSTMHSANSDSTGKSGTPIHDKTQSLVPPAKPPRTFMSDTMGQHSASSIHKEAQLGSAQMFSNAKQQQSSRLQRQGIQQFANNFDDDDQGNLERVATDNPWTASDEDIQFKYLEEQARIQYEGPEFRLNNEQTKSNANQCTHLQTQIGQDFPFDMNAQEQGQYPSEHLANKTHYSSKEHKQSGHHKGSIPRVPNAGKMGQTSSSHQDNWMDEMQIGQNGGQMEQQQSWQHRGYRGDGQQERLGQMPGTEHGRSLQPAQIGLNDGIVGPMHPHAQLNEVQLNDQGFSENVQGVQNQQRSKAQDCNIPKDRRHGNDQSSDTFSRDEGVSDYTRKSTYISDRELAQEQFDQRMNNPWFQEMVQNMTELVEREGLIVKDVFPDGNCLFTAVVDQLRVRGNFKYTPSTLRAASVDYLIKNSKQRDGTPLEHFLSNETWEHYLGRMSRDGEWGEHIVLGAISEVLRCRINVLGGMSGKSFTVVQPQYMSDNEEKEREKERKETKGGETISDSQTADKTISENPTADTAKSDKSPSKDETNSETSQSKTVSKPATPHTCEQSKSLHTGSASLPKPTDARVESTDTSQRKDQTVFRSKQNWDKENEELSQGEELFIGLLGEMHYVSLRKKDWEERLHEKLWARIQKREAQRKERSEEGSFSDDDMCLPEEAASEIRFAENVLDPFSTTSLPHFNHMLETISRFIIPSHTVNGLSCIGYEFEGYLFEVVGQAEFLDARFSQMPPRSSAANVLLSSNPTKAKPCVTAFYTPTDTDVCRDFETELKDIDLMMDTSQCVPGFVKLVPVMIELWPCENDERGRKMYLPHLKIAQNVGSVYNTEDTKVSIVTKRCISFRARWPDEAMEWIVRTRPHNWPSQEFRQVIIQNGCRIIPQDSHPSRLMWKIDFGLSEEIILNQAVSSDQRMGYRIWKLLFGDIPCNYQNKVIEVTRSVFFYACECISPAWWMENTGTCILHMIADFLLKIEHKWIPHYFMSSVNLFDQLPEDCVLHLKRKIQLMKAAPLISAYFCLDHLDISYEGPSSWIEAMFEDLRLFALDGDMGRSYRNVFLPSKLEVVRTMAEVKNYPYAAEHCMSVFVLHTKFEPDVTFPDFFISMLADIHPILKWCLAFYFDTFHGMSLLDAVCCITKTVPLSTVLGPLTTLNLSYARVPLECIQGANVLFFVDHFSFCLERMCCHKENITAICTFIKIYYIESTKKYAFDDSLERTVVDTTPYSRQFYIYQTVEDLINYKLYEIYKRLYDALCAIQRPREFRYYMDLFENVCDRYCKKSAYQFLAELWSWYNYQHRANITWIKCQSLRK